MRVKFTLVGCLCISLVSKPVRADLWGADLPLLVEIVANTLQTYHQLRQQTMLLEEELDGIRDKIHRFETIKEIVSPNNLEAWKDPREAVRRLEKIYYNLPPEFRTEKSDEVARQISQAMSVAGLLVESAKPAFKSGKQMEQKALDSSPGVANKLTASGVGTLVTLQSQNQVAQAQIISLLSQMIAENASKDAARLRTQSQEYKGLSSGLTGFSKQINLMEVKR